MKMLLVGCLLMSCAPARSVEPAGCYPSGRYVVGWAVVNGFCGDRAQESPWDGTGMRDLSATVEPGTCDRPVLWDNGHMTVSGMLFWTSSEHATGTVYVESDGYDPVLGAIVVGAACSGTYDIQVDRTRPAR